MSPSLVEETERKTIEEVRTVWTWLTDGIAKNTFVHIHPRKTAAHTDHQGAPLRLPELVYERMPQNSDGFTLPENQSSLSPKIHPIAFDEGCARRDRNPG
jgi:hypothetical protein